MYLRKMYSAGDSRAESGFTLIELLTVIGTLGVLASLAITGFSVYRASAAYAGAELTLRSARVALDYALSDADHPPPAIGATSQSIPGPITGAPQLLPGVQLSRNMKMQYAYDPTCIDLSCPWESFIEARHCQGKEYTRWIRFGDGSEVRLEHISGVGCP